MEPRLNVENHIGEGEFTNIDDLFSRAFEGEGYTYETVPKIPLEIVPEVLHRLRSISDNVSTHPSFSAIVESLTIQYPTDKGIQSFTKDLINKTIRTKDEFDM